MHYMYSSVCITVLFALQSCLHYNRVCGTIVCALQTSLEVYNVEYWHNVNIFYSYTCRIQLYEPLSEISPCFFNHISLVIFISPCFSVTPLCVSIISPCFFPVISPCFSIIYRVFRSYLPVFFYLWTNCSVQLN